MNNLSHAQMIAEASAVKDKLDDKGLVVEFVAPRMWEDPRTIDGGYTNNDPNCVNTQLNAVNVVSI